LNVSLSFSSSSSSSTFFRPAVEDGQSPSDHERGVSDLLKWSLRLMTDSLFCWWAVKERRERESQKLYNTVVVVLEREF
jgi:hypothetical protein